MYFGILLFNFPTLPVEYSTILLSNVLLFHASVKYILILLTIFQQSPVKYSTYYPPVKYSTILILPYIVHVLHPHDQYYHFLLVCGLQFLSPKACPAASQCPVMPASGKF
jgi:hypothetical protein